MWLDFVLGKGTYGSVYEAPLPTAAANPQSRVALKRVKAGRDGVPITAIRELRLLQERVGMHHPAGDRTSWGAPAFRARKRPRPDDGGEDDVVRLIDVVPAEKSLYMAFEFCEHDLYGLIASPAEFETAQVKLYLSGLLSALAAAHANGVLHRDVKGANVLVDAQGRVRLADWGLARRPRPGTGPPGKPVEDGRGSRRATR